MLSLLRLKLHCLAFHFLGKLKTSSVAPPWRTWLRTHHWLKDRKEKRKIRERRKAQLPATAGFEPGTFQTVVRCATAWAITKALHVFLKLQNLCLLKRLKIMINGRKNLYGGLFSSGLFIICIAIEFLVWTFTRLRMKWLRSFCSSRHHCIQ